MKLYIDTNNQKTIEKALIKIEKQVSKVEKNKGLKVDFKIFDENKIEINNFGELLIKFGYEEKLLEIVSTILKYSKIATDEEKKYFSQNVKKFKNKYLTDYYSYRFNVEEERFVLYLLRDIVLYDKKYLDLFIDFFMTTYPDYGDYQDNIFLDVADALDWNPKLYGLIEFLWQRMYNGRVINKNLVDRLKSDKDIKKFLNGIFPSIDSENEEVEQLRATISYIKDGGDFIFKSYKEIYETLLKYANLKIINKDIIKLLPDNISSIKGEEFAYLIASLKSPKSEFDTILLQENLSKKINKLNSSKKIEFFDQLSNYTHLINWDCLWHLFVNIKYKFGKTFFYEFIKNHDIKNNQKIYMFTDILESNMVKKDIETFIPSIIDIIKMEITNITNEESIKVMADILRKIGNEYKNHQYALEIYDEACKNNVLWEELKKQENAQKHKIIMEQCGNDVNLAFKNKDYKKVIKILSKYGDDLPDILKKKLSYSKKKV